MKYWLLPLVLMIAFAFHYTSTIEFVSDYTHTTDEAESTFIVWQIAKQQASHKLFSEVSTHLYSLMELQESDKSMHDTQDEVRALVAGIVKVEVLEESWDRNTFYIKVQAEIDPDDILIRIRELASHANEKNRYREQLIRLDKSFEGLRLDMLGLKKALNGNNSKYQKQAIFLTFKKKSNELSIVNLFAEGVAFYWGIKGQNVDYLLAFELFRKAADQGYADAQYNLARMYGNGEGVSKNKKHAAQWYRKAAEQGNSEAQNNLAVMYFVGEEVIRDYQQAADWLRKAADQGNSVAQNNLATLYKNGRGLAQNYQQAIKWYRKAAELGNPRAQNSLADMYDLGQGINRDYYQALKWYRFAANQGNARAQYNLARMYVNGRGVNQDFAKAVVWYKKAAVQGLDDAQYGLAHLYNYGNGLKQDYELAINWYQKAADQGHGPAQYTLAQLYSKGIGAERDHEKASKLFSESINKGHPHAMEALISN